jgi:type VI secretion system protein ImpM
MPCALFGKLISKRDFIAINMPRDLLLAWEAWLQASLSSSKNELKGDWLKAYLQAPLWRFWLGAEVCSVPVKGVFMSSMDGIGRHFPLTVFSFAPEGLEFEPPSDARDQSWYEAAESFLLDTIDAGDDYESVLAGFGSLAEGRTVKPVRPDNCITWQGTMVATASPLAPSGTLVPDRVGDQPTGTSALNTASEPEPLVDGMAGTDAKVVVDAWPSFSGDTFIEPVQPQVEDGSDGAVPEPVEAVRLEEQPNALAATRLMAASTAIPGKATVRAVSDPPAPGVDSMPVVLHTPVQSFGFTALGAMDLWLSNRRRSYWWTIGGHDLPAMSMAATGLPDPQVMTIMMNCIRPQPVE